MGVVGGGEAARSASAGRKRELVGAERVWSSLVASVAVVGGAARVPGEPSVREELVKRNNWISESLIPTFTAPRISHLLVAPCRF